MLSETTKHSSKAESIIAYSGYIFAGASAQTSLPLSNKSFELVL
jgi:hypothetical protein